MKKSCRVSGQQGLFGSLLTMVVKKALHWLVIQATNTGGPDRLVQTGNQQVVEIQRRGDRGLFMFHSICSVELTL